MVEHWSSALRLLGDETDLAFMPLLKTPFAPSLPNHHLASALAASIALSLGALSIGSASLAEPAHAGGKAAAAKGGGKAAGGTKARGGGKPGKGGGGAPAIQYGFNEDPGHYALQPPLGAPLRRMMVGWNEVERTKGAWNWTAADSRYEKIRAAGLRPVIVAVAAPCWANPSISPCHGHEWFPPDRAHDRNWEEFIKRLASRYPAAVGIEIWNEPNIEPLFLGGVDPVRYTELLRSAYRTIKRVNRNMPVVSGGLFASATSGPYGIADDEFLTAMYAAGARGSMDGIGIHPYPYFGEGETLAYEPAAAGAVLDRVRAVREAAGDSTPLWLTEVGESTTTQDGFPAAASEADQAADLIEILRYARDAGDVRVALVHRLIDTPDKPGLYAQLEGGFGVLRADGSAKPAACAISAELGGSLSCP